MSDGVRRAGEAFEDLEIVQRFVNTGNLMRGYDLLESPQSAAKWLSEVGYGLSGGAVNREELERLRALRERLRKILLSHNRPELQSPSDVGRAASELNRLVGSATLNITFDASGEPVLISLSTGLERLVEDLLSAAIRARYAGSWRRLKACANEECRWIFYDSSKNRSGTWCVMEICGARAKMRAYRERRSQQTR